MDEGLQKSRRNLILVSSAIVFIELAGVSFESVSVLNTTAKVQRPEFILWFLWASWAYLLIRYIQHLFELDDFGVMTRFESHAERLINPHISKLLEKHAPTTQFYNFGYKYLKRVTSLKWVQPVEVYSASESKPVSLGEIEIPSWLILSAWVRSFFSCAYCDQK